MWRREHKILQLALRLGFLCSEWALKCVSVSNSLTNAAGDATLPIKLSDNIALAVSSVSGSEPGANYMLAYLSVLYLNFNSYQRRVNHFQHVDEYLKINQ